MSTTTLPRLEVSMQPHRDPETTFRAYVANHEHWRMNQRHRERQAGQGDHYHGPMHAITRDGGAVSSVTLHPRFVEHMDSPAWSAPGEQRWRVVEAGLRFLHRDEAQRRMELAAWRHFSCPEHFRSRSTVAEAIRLEVDTTTLYRARDRVTGWLWEWIRDTGQAGHWA